MVPIPLPTHVPLPAPTIVPIPSPTSVPIPIPTAVPIPNPTVSLSPTVPIFPTSVPVPSPTSVPIPLPTKVPIPSPTSVPTNMPVTQSPTTSPTTIDTTSIDVSFDITADNEPTESEISSLKTTIANELGIPENDLKSFTITSTSIRRLTFNKDKDAKHDNNEEEEEEDKEMIIIRHHRRLNSYSWSVSFVVEVSLSLTDATTSIELADEITTTIESNTFQTAITSDVSSAIVDTSSVSTTPISPTLLPTFYPTMKPTFNPTLFPSIATGGNGSSGGNANSATTTYIIIAVVVIFVLAGIGLFAYRHNHHKQFGEDHEEDIHLSEAVELGQLEGGTGRGGSDSAQPLPKVKARPGVGRQTSFITEEDASTEHALAMLADVDLEDGGGDEGDGGSRGGPVQAGKNKRLSAELKDKQFVSVNAIVNNDNLTFVEKLDKLTNLGLSDADFENAKKFVLARTRATSSTAVVSTPNVPDLPVNQNKEEEEHDLDDLDEEEEDNEEDIKKNEELKKKQTSLISSIVNNDNITIAEKMSRLSELNLSHKDFDDAQKFILARSKAGLGAKEATLLPSLVNANDDGEEDLDVNDIKKKKDDNEDEEGLKVEKSPPQPLTRKPSSSRSPTSPRAKKPTKPVSPRAKRPPPKARSSRSFKEKEDDGNKTPPSKE